MQFVTGVCVLLVSVVQALAVNDGRYVVTAPKVARIGKPYTVSVILTEARNAAQTGSITLTHTTDKSKTKTQTFSINPSDNKKDVDVPLVSRELPPGKYNLIFQMVLGSESISQTTQIDVISDTGFCIMQTDKGIYKRSQTVKFRVVCLDADLMPVRNEMDITIIDPDKNKVEMYKKQTSVSGVITHEYALSDEPKLGDWTIHVQQSDGMGNITERHFTVDAYVLPRFSVEVKTASPYVYVKDFTEVQIDVIGMYTYGESVHGKASIECRLKGAYVKKMSPLIDGKATFKISTKDIGEPADLRSKLCSSMYCYEGEQSYPMYIHATIVEDETGEEHDTNSTLSFYTQPVAMKLVNKKEYRKNMTYTAYVLITDPSGSPLPKSERSKYYLNFRMTDNTDSDIFIKDHVALPTDMDDVILKFTTSTTTEYSIRMQGELFDQSGTKLVTLYDVASEYQSYGNVGVQISLMNSANSADGVRSATKTYNIGETIYVMAEGYSPKGFKGPLFLYIFAKGRQVRSFEVSPGSIKDILIDMGLAPSASLLLFTVTSENELVADEMEIFVSGLIKNQMTMQFNTARREVGTDVTLSVNSDPNSYIFLVAIDKGSLLLKEPNDITSQQLHDGVKNFDIREEKKDNNWIVPWAPRLKRFTQLPYFYSGTAAKNILQTVGIVCLTDAYVAVVNGAMEGIRFMASGIMFKGNTVQDTVVQSNNIESSSQIRKNFPETWIWLNDLTGSDGNFQTTVTLPDSITSWTTRGFSISPTTGLGIANNIQIEAFKQFFVVVSLPPSAIRGEKMEVKLVVFNYFDVQKAVVVTLKHSQDFMIFTDRTSTNPLTGDFQDSIQVPARLSKGTSLFISPTAIGNIQITVVASTGPSTTDVTDSVEKILPVDPEGKRKYGGIQQLFDVTSTPQTIKVYPDFPADFVPDSRKVTVAVTGDIMGQALQNLDDMIRVPFGCGEQNMISLVPNIYALSYMKAAGIVKAEIESKAIKNMQQGYQRELNYKHDNGGFSAFGKSDQSFSTWLTAFVMKSFAQASKFIFISDEVLQNAKEAIMSQSNRDGSFNEPGIVHHKDMMTGTSSGAMLTAYVYIALKETQKAGNSIPDSFDSSLTLTYLENFYKSSAIKTPFQLAVLSYCFALGNSRQLPSILADLTGSSTITENGDMQCWCNMKARDIDNQKSYLTIDIKPSAIETASYVLLTYIEQNNLSRGRPIVKWLMTQVNGKGGFMSTQDTVMGLQALSRYAELLSVASLNATITFKTTGHSDVIKYVNKDNSILLQTERLVNIDQIAADGVAIEVKGSGTAVVSVNWEYNVDVDETFKDLKITVENYKIDYYTTEIFTCAWYDGVDTGMTLIYVDIPTGYTVSNLVQLEEDKRISRVELDGRTLNLYFNEITKTKTCISVKAIWDYVVDDIKPCPVTAQFYYQPEKRSTAFYSVIGQTKPTGGAGVTCASNIVIMLIITVYKMFFLY